MGKNRIRKWLEATACPTLDYATNERVDLAAKQVVKCMRREGSFFSFRDTTTVLKVPLEDLVLVKERVYELTLKHVLEDYRIDQRDRQGLGWIARALRLEAKDARRIELRVGRQMFDEYLAFAIAGGHLSEDEIAEFRRLADGLRVTTRELLLLFLADSGEDFLKMVLAAMAEQQIATETDWARFTASLKALGLDEPELVRIMRAQSQRFRESLKNGRQRPKEADVQEAMLEVLLARYERIHPTARLAGESSN